MSSDLMQKVYCLGIAEGEGRSLRVVPNDAGCSKELKALQEASMKGGRTVRDSKCTAQSLQEEVEAVYSALDRVLWLGSQKGINVCQGLRKHDIFVAMPASLEP